MVDKNYTGKIYVSNGCKELIETSCKDVYVRHHPDFKDMPMSNGFIVKKMVDYWLYKENV